MEFRSRRSPVMGCEGVVASSQPLASSAGARILRDGGNAADAAVAMAAALAVTEPCSTGIGGDAFALYFDNKTKKTTAVLGNGAAPRGLVPPKFIDPLGTEAVTVPGAAAAWVDILDKFGTKSVNEVLTPAISLAENGFPVAKLTACQWKQSEETLYKADAMAFLPDGLHAPAEGEVFANPDLASVLKDLATGGKDAFYAGRVGAAIVHALHSRGGCMSEADLRNHQTIFTEPISISYRGVQVYEVPPPTHGIAALMALNIAQGFDDLKTEAGGVHNSAEYLHIMIGCMRLAYADARAYVADPDVEEVPTDLLLSAAYGRERRAQIGSGALEDIAAVDLSAFKNPDTVQFCAVDRDGNACSMINSNFLGFGSCIVPEGCGFSLHNRGLNFSVDSAHPNYIQPGKKPYHTIIPALATKDNELFAAFGVMGGFMQPQGHFQVLCNLVDWKMDPQSALDASRFCVGSAYTGTGAEVHIEAGIEEEIIDALRERGHKIVGPVGGLDRSLFGRGQVILYNPSTKVATAGSDPRADGMAIAV